MNELHFYNLNDKTLTLYSTIQDSVENFSKPKKRSHTVYLLTCYIDLKATKKIIYDLAKKIRITNVKLHFNFSEYYKLNFLSCQYEFKLLISNLIDRRKDQKI